MKLLINYLYWCFKFGEIMPWNVRLVSIRKLSEEEYNFPSTLNIDIPEDAISHE